MECVKDGIKMESWWGGVNVTRLFFFSRFLFLLSFFIFSALTNWWIFCSQILVWLIAMDVFSLAFLQMDGLRRRRRIVRKISFFGVPRPRGGEWIWGRMHSWRERLNGRGRRGIREENILVFDRKLKIVEIFSAEVEKSIGRVLSSSYDVFLFFSLSPSVYPLILFPRYAVFISTNCSKRH